MKLLVVILGFVLCATSATSLRTSNSDAVTASGDSIRFKFQSIDEATEES